LNIGIAQSQWHHFASLNAFEGIDLDSDAAYVGGGTISVFARTDSTQAFQNVNSGDLSNLDPSTRQIQFEFRLERSDRLRTPSLKSYTLRFDGVAL
jgi:hypothetical protein